jgi:hypothetical protein
MSDLRIERLRVRVENAAGHAHRLEPVTRLAAALLAERLAGRLTTGPALRPASAPLVAAPVRVSLARMSDEAAARRIASAWLAVLTPGSGAAPSSGPADRRP